MSSSEKKKKKDQCCLLISQLHCNLPCFCMQPQRTMSLPIFSSIRMTIRTEICIINVADDGCINHRPKGKKKLALSNGVEVMLQFSMNKCETLS